MTAMQAIYGRRAVRNYETREIPKDKIRELLRAAVQAPSAVNQQPWAFAIFQGADLLKKFSDDAKKQYLREISVERHEMDKLKDHLTSPDFNIFYNAPTLIIVLAKNSGMYPSGDCWMAAQNLMLAAYEQGLGTCAIGLALPWLHLPHTKRELGIRDDLTSVAPIIIGYPAENPPAPPRNEPEIIVWK